MDKFHRWQSITIIVCIFLLTACQNQRIATEYSTSNATNSTKQIKSSNEKVLLDAPLIAQKPELLNGCEVTSLAMLLQYEGINVDKMTLAEEVKKDPTPVTYNAAGKIAEWGDPSEGFVGDITGNNIGYGVYNHPIIELMSSYLPGRVVDLSGESFETLEYAIDGGHPILIWVTGDFNLPNEHVTWQHNGKIIEAAFDEHVVLLVGYDKTHVYVNNPLNEEKNQKIDKETFIKVWNSMGSKAVSYV